MQYIGHGFQIDIKQGLIQKGDETISLRAKTLQVLVMLLREKDSVVSKEQMLTNIWSDVVVQEQVLVQSIKEIRDALSAEVIKTFPRLGYQWVAPVDVVEAESTYDRKWLNPIVFASVFLLLLIAACVTVYFSPSPIKSQRIAFLPVVNQLADTSHNWVSIKGQRFLSDAFAKASDANEASWHIVSPEEIHYAFERLSAEELSAVQQGDYYVLLQNISADVVVASRLQGYPEDYQLQYKLYFPYAQEQGVVFSQHAEQGFNELVKRLTSRFNMDEGVPAQIQFQTDFSHAALVDGINFYLNGQFNEAITLLKAANQATPDYLPVGRYLGASYANIGDFEKGINVLKQSLLVGDHNDAREVMRTHLLLGFLLYSHASTNPGILEEAYRHISLAKQQAKSMQDHLFEAYGSEELAKVLRQQGKLLLAEQELTYALGLHQQLPLNYGQTATLIELAKLLVIKGQHQDAWKRLTQAMKIAQEAKVPANQIWVLFAKTELAQQENDVLKANQFLDAAAKIALDSDDLLLVARVETFRNRAFPLVN